MSTKAQLEKYIERLKEELNHEKEKRMRCEAELQKAKNCEEHFKQVIEDNSKFLTRCLTIVETYAKLKHTKYNIFNSQIFYDGENNTPFTALMEESDEIKFLRFLRQNLQELKFPAEGQL